MYSTHAMLAALTKTPELALEENEASALAHSAATVASYYDFGASIAPEVAAWVSLAQTVAFIYGPRIFAVRARKRLVADEASPQPAPGFNGAPFHGMV